MPMLPQAAARLSISHWNPQPHIAAQSDTFGRFQSGSGMKFRAEDFGPRAPLLSGIYGIAPIGPRDKQYDGAAKGHNHNTIAMHPGIGSDTLLSTPDAIPKLRAGTAGPSGCATRPQWNR
ncbi:hypothetical protein [Novosphingobium humi]|uniref:Uncharacterized protein n=1 Tax=Novosphingobium humi TaxID=2282397 RepID=A0ABY7TSI7_9SPHN|nr:hypothetical protein [Novosphingobium humi]WCT76162.1 hypothetical protein PQ457_09380 [Novosphingobium humi]